MRSWNPLRLSVRARLTLVAGVLTGAALSLVAIVTPGVVDRQLVDDLLRDDAVESVAFVRLDSGVAEIDDPKVPEVVDPDELPPIDELDLGVLFGPDGPLGTDLFSSDAIDRLFEDDLGSLLESGELEMIFDELTRSVPADLLEQLPDEIVFSDVDEGDFFNLVVNSLFPVEDSELVPKAEAYVARLDGAGVYDDLFRAADSDRIVIGFGGDKFVLVDDGGRVEPVNAAADPLAVPVVSSEQLDELLDVDLPFIELEPGRFVPVPGEDPRLVFASVTVEGIEVVSVVDASAVDRTVDRLRAVLWVAVPILTALVAAIAWLLASRALRPVRSITDQAATISGGTLDARVPVPDTDDEISTLAVTVNEMLDRLEDDDHRRRRFVSDASHELRSPVAVMRNEAEVALAHPDSADVRELAGAVAAESTRMSAIIDDLLALARQDEGTSAPTSEVDLDDVVLAEAARARRVPIDTSGVSAGRVRGRPDELTRMVGHLLDNAARHAASTVRVWLHTSEVGDVRSVELIVDDDGVGIPPDQRTVIFERFARLDEARTRDHGGAGLGLAVVAGVADRTGGHVEVGDSDLGGARFVVTLPAV